MSGVEIEDVSVLDSPTLHPLSVHNSPMPHTPHTAQLAHMQWQASPMHVQGSPMHMQASPMHMQASPAHLQASPAHVQQSPSRQHQATEPSPGMRRRQAPKEEKPDTVRRLVRSLKTLDVYPKTDDASVLVKTGSGGLVSLISMAIIALLVLTELWAYLHTKSTHSILVDTRPSSRLQVNLDITFPALRCSDTSIDVMDVSGDVQVATAKNIHRTRLDAAGRPIGTADYADRAHAKEDAQRAELTPLMQAMGINLPPQQQMGGPDLHTDQRGEGCHIVATLQVNKVAGNIHVALGGAHAHDKPEGEADKEDHAESGHTTGSPHSDHGASAAHGSHGGASHSHGSVGQQHVHQFMIHELANYNCSHRINQMSFGELFPGEINPLDGVEQVIPQGQGTAHFQYFVKIVPTVYESSFGHVTDTNQFSVTQQTQLISMQDAFRGDAGRIPGVFFVYDLSPFIVRVTERRTPLSTFLTYICAIVGGVITVAGVIDSMLFASVKMVKVASPMAKKS